MWGNKSGRSVPLPDKWRFIRANVLRRDNYLCVKVREDTGQACGAKATDVNHIGDPDDHRHANLESLCSYHHDQDTASRGGRSQRSAQAKNNKRKPHPGVQRFD